MRKTLIVILAFTGCSKPVQPEPVPVVGDPIFGTPSSIVLDHTSATLSCEWRYDGAAADVTEQGFAFRPQGANGWSTAKATTEGNPMRYALRGLGASSTYEYYAYLIVSGKTFQSATASLTTPAKGENPTPTPDPDDPDPDDPDPDDPDPIDPTPVTNVHRTTWMELPTEDKTNTDYYYGYHQRADVPGIRNYSVCYSNKMHSCVWAAMPMHPSYKGTAERGDKWGNAWDPDILKSVQPNLSSSYKPSGSGYSRGHMVASSDRRTSVATEAQTYYYTNMAPQWQNSFNSGIWNNLEVKIQNEYISQDTLYVVTGVYWANTSKTLYDGTGSGTKVTVPTHFYKVLLRSKSGNTNTTGGLAKQPASNLKCVGFLFENRAYSGSLDASYLKSVADIEKLTGHKFFANVPNAPKTTYVASEWGM